MTDQFELKLDKEKAEQIIVDAQKHLSFDIKEYPIEVHAQKLKQEDYVIPEYQRKHTWNEEKQSKFIESLLMGIPIPYMFGVEDEEAGIVKIIDGSQRLNTIKAFLNNELILKNMDKLDLLNGWSYDDLPKLQQRKFRHRTIRMIVMPEADSVTEFEIFERINTSPEIPKPSEIRRGAFPGPITDLMIKCADNPEFIELTPLPKSIEMRRRREELIIRLFAYANEYRSFKHDVSRFLNEYLQKANAIAKKSPETIDAHKHIFNSVLEFSKKYLSKYGGFKSPLRNFTPNVRFESLSVGIALALKQNPEINPENLDWLKGDPQFDKHIRTDATNSAPKLRARVEFVRDKILGK